jgi:hypothetical protein
MRYVTRERLHVDRIATAWAIRRFVDADATFAFVARERDPGQVDGTAFDMRGAELSHRGGKCTFEVLIERHALEDPALHRMAAIVHGADLPHEDGAPAESAGIQAMFDGIRDAEMSDDDRLSRGAAICEALYAYCGRAAV